MTDEWRDIESAPRDGSTVLLWCTGVVYSGSWEELDPMDDWDESGIKGWWNVPNPQGSGSMDMKWMPTRWQSLPAPAAQKDEAS